MKVLIGNPPWSRPGYYGVRAGSRWPHMEAADAQYMPFPFYMAYASAVLQRSGHETELLDGCAERCDAASFLRRAVAVAPDVVVLEISTASLSTDRDMVRRLRAALGRDVPIVWCGAHSWLEGEEPDVLATDPDVDYFMKGEYEYTLLELVEALRQGGDLRAIPGLLFRDRQGDTVTNAPRTLLKKIDEYPWPDREQLPMDLYVEAPAALPQPVLQMWASRGCPFKCDFCIWPQFMYGGRNYRTRDVDDVVAEMVECVPRYGQQAAYFDDDTFNLGKRRMKEFARALKERGSTVPWGLMGRADTFDQPTFAALAESGLEFIKFGVESGEQRIVDAMEKALDLEQVRRAVSWARELGVKTHLTFSFGHPGETWDSARKTIDFALELSPDSLQFSLMQPFPGSALYEKARAQGLIAEEDFDKFDGRTSSPIRTEHLSPDDLAWILHEANRRWRRHQLRRTIKNVGVRQVVYGLRHPRHLLHVVREAVVG